MVLDQSASVVRDARQAALLQSLARPVWVRPEQQILQVARAQQLLVESLLPRVEMIWWELSSFRIELSRRV